MTEYVNIYDLLFNGAEDCDMTSNRNEVEAPYLTVVDDSREYAYRPHRTVLFKGRRLAGQIDKEFVSVGLLDDARKALMADLNRFALV